MSKSLSDILDRAYELARVKYESRNLPENKRKRLLMLAKVEQLKHQAETQKIKNQVSKWLELNEEFIKPEHLKQLWRNTSINTCKQFVELAIKSLAIVDGINKSEDVFSVALDMKQIELDKGDIASLSDKVFSVGVLDLILNNTSLSIQEKQSIKDRYISSKFPYKDISAKPDPLSYNISREIQDLQSRAK